MKEFIKTVYELYPKNISAIGSRNEYLTSIEHIELNKRLSDENSIYGLSNIELAKTRIESAFKTKIEDHTVNSWLDRCYNWQFLLNPKSKESKKLVMCINISKVKHIYIIYILEVEFSETLGRLKYLPRRNLLFEQQKFKAEIEEIEEILSSELLMIKPFPKKKLDDRIIDVSFQDIEIGDFTMFNAFFLNDFTTRFA
ncbi:MAG: hypothetical protein WBG90_05250 [Saonia sp.]